MPSIILSDNGVSSGSAGLKTTASNDGALELQTSTAGGTATTALSISNTQVVTVTNGVSIQGLTVGRGAGSVSTNTAVGASALAANTSGASNSGFGYQALKSVTTNSDNSAFGTNSLRDTSTGAANSAFGSAALIQNTTGSYNTAIGQTALFSNTTSSYNTAVGYQAGYSYNNTSGNGGNSLFGVQAGYALTTGYQNTIIGAAAGSSLTTGTFNTFVGAQGSGGFGSGSAVTTGTRNTILGSYNGNQGGLDIRTSSNFIVLSDGDGNPRVIVDNSGYFRCPGLWNLTTASSANLYTDSTGQVYRSTSALKYKQDVRDVEGFDISSLRPVRYKSKCEGDDQTKDHLGLIADEAAEAGFEELVTRGADGEVEGFQYERLTVVLLKELQTLKAKVAALENQ